MKAITKTVEEVIAYEAYDGTRFSSKEECEKYENSAEYAAEKAAFALQTHKSNCADSVLPYIPCCEDEWRVFDIKTAEHLRILNTHIKLRDPDCVHILSPDYIGKQVCIGYAAYNNWMYVVGTRESMEAEFKKSLDYLFRDKD